MSELKRNTTLAKKFLMDKKGITLEDCMMYVEEYHPEDKGWFFHIATDIVDLTDKDGNPTGKKGVRPFLTIKKKIYERYFSDSSELSARMKMFSHWDIEKLSQEPFEDEKPSQE